MSYVKRFVRIVSSLHTAVSCLAGSETPCSGLPSSNVRLIKSGDVGKRKAISSKDRIYRILTDVPDRQLERQSIRNCEAASSIDDELGKPRTEKHMQRFLTSVASALGVTTLCCMWIAGPLVSTGHNILFHWSGPASTLFLPVFLDFIAIWVLFTFLLFAALGDGKKATALWVGTVFLLPSLTLKSFSLLRSWPVPHWMSRGLAAFSLTVALLLLSPWADPHRDRLARVRGLVTTVFSFTAISGVLLLSQLLWFSWRARSFTADRSFSRISGPPASTRFSHPRIIWIVLDELSYRQVYEHRFPGLQLPAFDQLARQGTIFTNTVPAGIMTEIVLPSLMLGVPIDKIRPSAAGELALIHNAQTDAWQSFNQHSTVFEDALDAKYKTAVAGWYIPYCRILPDVLDQCFWNYSSVSINKMLPGASSVDNALNPLLLNLQSLGLGIRETDARMHVKDFQDLWNESDQILNNRSLDFVLLHMPVPHPGGIFRRTSHTYSSEGTDYLDNLVLADYYLAHVESVLESQGEWDHSAVILMGDHSWRTKLFWSATKEWTREEQQASDDGAFDPRPGYIVKLPNQETGSTIHGSFAAVKTRELLDAIMDGEIRSSEDLFLWVRKNG